jgi:hypothetical protein
VGHLRGVHITEAHLEHLHGLLDARNGDVEMSFVFDDVGISHHAGVAKKDERHCKGASWSRLPLETSGVGPFENAAARPLHNKTRKGSVCRDRKFVATQKFARELVAFEVRACETAAWHLLPKKNQSKIPRTSVVFPVSCLWENRLV